MSDEKSKGYTPQLLRQFDALTKRLSSPRQMTRIAARLDAGRFEEEHGKAVCDEMFAVLQARDAKRASR